MKAALFAALGGLVVITLVLALYLSSGKPPAPAPARAAAAAAEPNPGKLQHMLAQQSNEIRRLKKEKTA